MDAQWPQDERAVNDDGHGERTMNAQVRAHRGRDRRPEPSIRGTSDERPVNTAVGLLHCGHGGDRRDRRDRGWDRGRRGRLRDRSTIAVHEHAKPPRGGEAFLRRPRATRALQRRRAPRAGPDPGNDAGRRAALRRWMANGLRERSARTPPRREADRRRSALSPGPPRDGQGGQRAPCVPRRSSSNAPSPRDGCGQPPPPPAATARSCSWSPTSPRPGASRPSVGTSSPTPPTN